MRKLLPVLLCAAAQFVALAADPAKAGMDKDRLALIPVRMKELVDKGTLSGAVTLVARHGVVASLDAVGWQDVEAKKPMRVDSIFQIMSMTKPMTAVGIMMLVDEGRIAVSDPVEKYLPEFRGQWMISSRDENTRTLKRPPRRITVRDLLTHTSGMPSMPPEGIKELYQRMDKTLAEAVSVYSQMPLEFEPGTKWQYSNPGIATLGRIIEVVSGQPYEKFLDTRIFAPLGMRDTFIFPPADKLGRIALVYKVENKKLVRAGTDILAGDPAEYRKGAKYSGPELAVYSTASDLAAFYQMVLNGGTYNGKRLLSRAAVELMTSLQTGDIKMGVGYGLAWTVVRDEGGTLQMQSIGTYGHGGAFGTLGWVDPKKDLVGVLMIQSAGGAGPDASNALRQLAAAAITE